MIADARHAKEAAEVSKSAAYPAVASGLTAGQAIALGSRSMDRLELFPHPKTANAKAGTPQWRPKWETEKLNGEVYRKGKSENRGERPRMVAQHQAVGLSRLRLVNVGDACEVGCAVVMETYLVLLFSLSIFRFELIFRARWTVSEGRWRGRLQSVFVVVLLRLFVCVNYCFLLGIRHSFLVPVVHGAFWFYALSA